MDDMNFISPSKIKDFYIPFMSDADDALKVKFAMQELCLEIENGYMPVRKSHFVRPICRLIVDKNNKIRWWAYKLAYYLNVTDSIDIIKSNIKNVEEDDYDLCWAIAALYGLCDEDEISIEKKITDKINDKNHLIVSANMFKKTKNLREVSLNNIIDDKISLAMLCLVKGHGGNYLGIKEGSDLIKSLQKSDDERLVEYSLWSFHRAKSFLKKNILIEEHNLKNMSENVRRWYYNLYLQIDNLDYDFLYESIKRERKINSNSSLEAIAGSLPSEMPRKIEHLIYEWIYSEENILVIINLIKWLCACYEKSTTASHLLRAIFEDALSSPSEIKFRNICDIIIVNAREAGYNSSLLSMVTDVLDDHQKYAYLSDASRNLTVMEIDMSTNFHGKVNARDIDAGTYYGDVKKVVSNYNGPSSSDDVMNLMNKLQNDEKIESSEKTKISEHILSGLKLGKSVTQIGKEIMSNFKSIAENGGDFIEYLKGMV